MKKIIKEYVEELLLIREGRASRLIEALSRYPKDGSVSFHFSNLNKLGINPKSGFDTPIAVCGYPLVHHTEKQLIEGSLPFASNRAFVHFYRAKNPDRVVNLSALGWNDSERLADKVARANDLDERTIARQQDDEDREEEVGKPGWSFWNFLYRTYHGHPVQWATALRRAGIEGVIDFGNGIFHPNEPWQTAFFSGAYVELLDTFDVPGRDADERQLGAKYFIKKSEEAHLWTVTLREFTKALFRAVDDFSYAHTKAYFAFDDGKKQQAAIDLDAALGDALAEHWSLSAVDAPAVRQHIWIKSPNELRLGSPLVISHLFRRVPFALLGKLYAARPASAAIRKFVSSCREERLFSRGE